MVNLEDSQFPLLKTLPGSPHHAPMTSKYFRLAYKGLPDRASTSSPALSLGHPLPCPLLWLNLGKTLPRIPLTEGTRRTDGGFAVLCVCRVIFSPPFQQTVNPSTAKKLAFGNKYTHPVLLTAAGGAVGRGKTM